MKKIVLALVATLFGIALTGCNTVAGAGKDIERAGESIQGAAKK